jgi:hypothetical protein
MKIPHLILHIGARLSQYIWRQKIRRPDEYQDAQNDGVEMLHDGNPI